MLFAVGKPVRSVYFPESGVASLLAASIDGVGVEVATVGREGMIGLPVFLGSTTSATQAVMQIPGEVWVIDVPSFRRHLRSSEALRNMLNLYTQALFTLVAQSSLCNRLHSIRERCNRWLLTTHDRVDSDSFPLTHEFLARMLGVRRASVSEVAARLQSERLITYRRGTVRIVNRRAMERASCECYRIVRGEFDRLLDGKPQDPFIRTIQRRARDGKILGPPR